MARDFFSTQAADYARWRPGYPRELIEYIVSFAQCRHAAWDAATGNGQAPVLLADHFEKVAATDLSSRQLQFARPHPRIEYSQGAAEQPVFADNSFDLVTVAQAYHWLNQPAFCREARRVARPGAVVAVWGYDLCRTGHEGLNEHIRSFYSNTMGPYWDAARRQVDEHYRGAYFDFEEIAVEQSFAITMRWTLEDMRGYLNSWSATQQYIKVHGVNPVEAFVKEIKGIWDEETEVRFPVFLRMGRC